MPLSSSDAFSTPDQTLAHESVLPDSQPWTFSSQSNSQPTQDVQMTQLSPPIHERTRKMNLAESGLTGMGYNMRDPSCFPVPVPEFAWLPSSADATYLPDSPTADATYLPDSPTAPPAPEEPVFFRNPYPRGRVPVELFQATEARLRNAYEQLYAVLRRIRANPSQWTNEERLSVTIHPEWNMGGGSRCPGNAHALVELVIVAVRAYVAFIQQNVPVDPEDFRRRATDWAFDILEVYRLDALDDVARITQRA